MADSNHNDDVRIDNLRLRVPAGPRFAGLGPRAAEQLATQIGSKLALGNHGTLALDRLHLRIPEHELGMAPADAIARAINRQLRGGVR
jgi:hypothetical protein